MIANAMASFFMQFTSFLYRFHEKSVVPRWESRASLSNGDAKRDRYDKSKSFGKEDRIRCSKLLQHQSWIRFIAADFWRNSETLQRTACCGNLQWRRRRILTQPFGAILSMARYYAFYDPNRGTLIAS
jgi:hypothetical protein